MALKDIIGQDKAVKILAGTLGRHRLPSSYLFAGEAGIGKKFTAMNFAKAVNCLNPEARSPGSSFDVDACDECLSCQKTDSGVHPDLLVVSPEKFDIKVDEIRALEEFLSFKPYESRKKIAVVNDAEALNISAANAFLKTLEEPPADSLIILITSAPDRLPKTILSRCHRVNFMPLSPKGCEEVVSKVRNEKSAEKTRGTGRKPQALEHSRLLANVRLSMGKPGLAADCDMVEDRDRVIRLFCEMFNEAGRETWSDRRDIEEWLGMFLIVMRDMAVLKITGSSDAIINIDIRDDIMKLSKTMDLKTIIDNYYKLSLLREYLRFNLNKSILWNYVSFLFKDIMGTMPL